MDFEKAFDSLDRDSLWKLLRHYGVPDKVDHQCGSDADIRARLGKARTAFIKLKNVFISLV